MNFLDNKYTRWYLAICEKAKLRPTTRKECTVLFGYVELHHVIPRSLGGTDVVYLTAREHFICHRLLVRMTEGVQKNKMRYAVQAMLMAKDRRGTLMTSRVYAKLRQEMAELRKGTTQSEETRKKISESLSGIKRSDETKLKMSKSLTGRKLSDETKKKMSSTRTGELRSEETKAKISEARTGKGLGPLSEEHKAKISASKTGKTGRKLSEETKSKMAEARRLYWLNKKNVQEET